MTEPTKRDSSSEDLPELTLPGVPTIDDTAAAADALREKLSDAQTPGFQAEFDPEEATRAGAFKEDALSEHDAAGSSEDLAAGQGQEQLAFLDDDGPSKEIPPFITTTNARELFDLRPGETVTDAIARRDAKAG